MTGDVLLIAWNLCLDFGIQYPAEFRKTIPLCLLCVRGWSRELIESSLSYEMKKAEKAWNLTEASLQCNGCF